MTYAFFVFSVDDCASASAVSRIILTEKPESAKWQNGNWQKCFGYILCKYLVRMNMDLEKPRK